jgi:poly(3-hydroxybutyrate) depolymerase
MLPTAKGTCPVLATGNSVGISLNGTSMPWTLYVGTKAATPTGPIIIYWHGTGTTGSADVGWGIGQAAINDVVAKGGIVAAAETTSSTGTNTGDNVWYTGDVDWADFIIACAIKQLNIDTRHIHASGYSAGALQSGYMYYARSGYLASVVVYSGGAGIGGGTFQDPSNVEPLIGAHGANTSSGDFLAASTTMFEMAVKTAGAPIVIDCDDGGTHTDITRLTRLAPSTYQFFKDHPFKQGKPDPYAGGIPSGFPTYCKII